ncbi:MAG: HAD family hydrolase [Candidatus Kapaibacterium sp.]
MTKAVFFDRDGVINARIKGAYIRNWEEFDFLPDVGEVLQKVKAKGYLAIIITNQRGVGLGLMSQTDLDDIHARLQKHFNWNYDVQFDEIFYCTDKEDTSERRKPSPAMLLEASKKWDIDLASSWMVGDSISDIEAGERAGTKTAYLVTRHTERIPKATVVIHRITDLLQHV